MKGRNYRIGKGMAYVRKKYIHGAPPPKITKFTMGNPSATFSHKLLLISLKKVQIRHNSIEAARIAVNRVLTDKLGNAYALHIRPYPHIILRENKMMAFAGADRLQEGMRRSFGKPAGLAARVNIGQPIIEVDVDASGVDTAKEALHLCLSKLPMPCSIEVTVAQPAESESPS